VRHWLEGDRAIPLMVTRLFELKAQIKKNKAAR